MNAVYKKVGNVTLSDMQGWGSNRRGPKEIYKPFLARVIGEAVLGRGSKSTVGSNTLTLGWQPTPLDTDAGKPSKKAKPCMRRSGRG